MQRRCCQVCLRSIIQCLIITLITITIGCVTPGVKNNQMGLDHLQNGRFVDAEKEFSEAVKVNPNNPIFINNLGVACEKQGRTEEAINYYQKAIKENDNNAMFFSNLGGVYYTQGKLEDALKQYDKALAINPIHPTVSIKKVELEVDMGNIEKYLLDLEESIKDAKPDGSSGINKVFIPEQAILHAYYLMGKYDDLISRATKDIDVLKSVDTQEGGYVIPIVTPFFIFIKSVPKKEIKITGILGSLYKYRGLAYLRKGDINSAIIDLKLSVNSVSAGFGNLSLGIALLEAGDSREAAYQLRKFIERYPNIKLARLYYAAALRLSGETLKADEELIVTQKMAMGKVNVSLKSNYEYVEALAFTDQLWERYDNAIQEYNQVLLFCPSCGRPYRNLGEIYLKLKDEVRARGNIEKAAAIMPADQRTKKLLDDLLKFSLK